MKFDKFQKKKFRANTTILIISQLSMLSILIPIYNCDVTNLVQALHQQCIEHGVPFEICCYDDQSDVAYKTINQSITQYSHIHYQELPNNVGRSKIRNTLAANAQHPYLLFMDGDAKVINEQFIQNYLKQINPSTLLYGGCLYASDPPIDPLKQLHYQFGKDREEIAPSIRSKTPYQAFKTFNFLIPKALFDTIRFDERIAQYGHEDTLFGMELERKGIPILHIDNPLEHLGIEDRDRFLQKQQLAIDNLYQLYLENRAPASKLLKTFGFCKRLYITNIVRGILNLLFTFIGQQLAKPTPKIFYLDLYKLRYLLNK